MTFLDKLERRVGFIAVPGLLRYVAALTALTFILYKFQPTFLQFVDLDRAAILRGEVWRLVTYIFIPALGSLLPVPDWFNAAFMVLFLIWVGDRLEDAWGSFRLTLFFLVGMAGTTVAAFVFDASFSNAMLISSIFFAFARFFPDVIIYFAYLIPLKVKWIAWGYAAILALQFVVGSLSAKAAILVAFANYFLFFGRDIFNDAKHRRRVRERRTRFDAETREAATETLHHCAICGATELTDPNLEFRVAADGEEYCVPHLEQARATRA
ncbi:MAG: rhomboid family intramembrane serine protease [Verrucomicrobiota bacterium]|nr:rhomboid family intramembrane serine protease [Verrucomicrobiota bacterium]